MEENTFVEPYGFVYITTNMVNGKKYIGQRGFSDGWQTYLGSGIVFKQALKKYGKENFVRKIVCICNSEEELNDVEYQLSVLLDVVESDDYYNLVYGGGTSRGWHPSQETKDKIGAKMKERLANPENHPMYGKEGLAGDRNPMFGVSPKERMDEETYQKWYEKHVEYWKKQSKEMSGKHTWGDGPNPNFGKPMSNEQKELLSKLAKERYKHPEDHPMYGKRHSEDTRKKMSEAKKGKTTIHNCKPVYCIELHQCFYSAYAADETLHLSKNNVGQCCRGRHKTAGKHPETGEKLHWLYAKDAIDKGYITQECVDKCFEQINIKGEN